MSPELCIDERWRRYRRPQAERTRGLVAARAAADERSPGRHGAVATRSGGGPRTRCAFEMIVGRCVPRGATLRMPRPTPERLVVAVHVSRLAVWPIVLFGGYEAADAPYTGSRQRRRLTSSAKVVCPPRDVLGSTALGESADPCAFCSPRIWSTVRSDFFLYEPSPKLHKSSAGWRVRQGKDPP
jgi:hypothetical protein